MLPFHVVLFLEKFVHKSDIVFFRYIICKINACDNVMEGT